MSTENTPAPKAQEENPRLSDAEIVPAMREALKILRASVEEAVSLNSTVTYAVHEDGTRWAFFACINYKHSGHGSTPFSAVAEAMAEYGSPESRRAKEVAELSARAEKLGLRVVESEVAK